MFIEKKLIIENHLQLKKKKKQKIYTFTRKKKKIKQKKSFKSFEDLQKHWKKSESQHRFTLISQK